MINYKERKAYIFSDNNKKSHKIKKIIEKKFRIFSLKKSNLIIVIGGDGFMLKTLKRPFSNLLSPNKKYFFAKSVLLSTLI